MRLCGLSQCSPLSLSLSLVVVVVLFRPSYSSIHPSVFSIVHSSRNEATSSVVFSLLVHPNHAGEYEYEALVSHAFPCGIGEQDEWIGAQAELIFPCLHYSMLHDQEYLDAANRTPVNASLRCTPIAHLSLHYTGVILPIEASLSLQRPYVTPFSVPPRHIPSNSFDLPILRISYTRRFKSCVLQCPSTNSLVFSTSSCKAENFTDATAMLCTFERRNRECLWRPSRHNRSTVMRGEFVKLDKHVELNAEEEEDGVDYTSPFWSHTTERCTLRFDARVYGKGLIVYYSTLSPANRSIDNATILSVLRNEKFVSYNAHLGHFSHPVRLSIRCLQGSLCSLDNIALVHCEDENDLASLCPRGFLCSSSRHAKCLSMDRQCDMIRDCDGGEDEEDCDNLPRSSRCNFSEGTTDEYCHDWKIFKGQLPRIEYSTKDDVGVERSLRFFDAPSPAEREVMMNDRSRFTSPILPPTSERVVSETSPLFHSCKLRFSYCSSGVNGWSTLEWKAVGDSTTSLWRLDTLSNNTVLPGEKCLWRRSSISIPRQTAPYHISLDITTLYRDDWNFEMAALSIAPSCYIDDAELSLPQSYSLWSCNKSGSYPPTPLDCLAFYNETDESDELTIEGDGWQRFSVPSARQYKLELCGAAGGSVRSRKGGNGSCVVAVLDLAYSEQLEILIGQRGRCSSKDCLVSSGGGATVVKRNGQIIFVAGGGEGKTATEDGDEFDSRHPDSLNETEIKELLRSWKQGDAASFAFYNYSSTCPDCDFFTLSTLRGGVCNGSEAAVLGGYGGGGPACGLSPGPGGGFVGGLRRGTVSTRGSSFVPSHTTSYILEESVHAIDGFVRIYPCTLQCKNNFTCVFVGISREENEMDCICGEGNICEDEEGISLWSFISIVLLIVGLVLLLLFGAVQKKYAIIERLKLRRKVFIRKEFVDKLVQLHNLNDMEMESLNKERMTVNIPFIDKKDIVIHEKIGHGEFSKVYRAQLKEKGKPAREVAVKILRLGETTEDQVALTLELYALNRTRKTESIVSCLGINAEFSPFWIVFEYMELGDMRTYLRAIRPPEKRQGLTTGSFLKLGMDVCSGCMYLVENFLVHRDLAARNCLLTAREGTLTAKLADFGMARDVYSAEYYRKEGHAKLPVKWLPPESILDGVFTTKSDVWSFGIVMWEIFAYGRMPYPGWTNQQVIQQVKQGSRPEYVRGTPLPVYNLMFSCWDAIPDRRPDFITIESQLTAIINNPAIARLELVGLDPLTTASARSEENDDLLRPVTSSTPLTHIAYSQLRV